MTDHTQINFNTQADGWFCKIYCATQHILGHFVDDVLRVS